jgi:hypothetical protein
LIFSIGSDSEFICIHILGFRISFFRLTVSRGSKTLNSLRFNSTVS